MASLQKAFSLALYASEKPEIPINELLQIHEEQVNNRRKFLKESAGILLGGVALSSCTSTSVEPQSPNSLFIASRKGNPAKIAIIGGGIAGLNAAYQLKKAGIIATVYEASSRTGGRIYTALDVFGAGISTEIGGEFIDSGHLEMLSLAREFGLELIDTQQDTFKKEHFFINGQAYSLAQVVEAFGIIAPKIRADQKSINGNLTNNVAVQLDNMPMQQYLQALGAPEWLMAILDAAYVAEFGQATAEQSTLNFLTLIGSEPNSFEVFGISDERYKIKGGNDQITKALSAQLDGQIQLGAKLTSLVQDAKGYILKFEGGMQTEADYVILALPFTILRNVELSLKELKAEKVACINEYGYGDNAKLILGFNQKIWRQEGFQGYLFNEKVSDGWDSSQLQAPTGAAYTVYTGGQAARTMAQNSNNKALEIAKYLPIVEQAFGNRVGRFNGKAMIADWPMNQYVKASYGCFRPGQFTKYYALAGESVGNVLFAGEHCSQDFQGFMEGGAETGKAAALSLLKKINSLS